MNGDKEPAAVVRRRPEIAAWAVAAIFAALSLCAGWEWHSATLDISAAHEDGKRGGYEIGYHDGYTAGILAGQKQACRSFCAVEGNLGLFDEGGCFCVGPKQGRQILDDAVDEGLLELTPEEQKKLQGRVQ